ncbi:zinc-dependent metalloprotease [Aureisphaera galaxeae]|uniref:zinc-dependent metalloprotease n=1 Tax=Aureisphaera galaxeae TaxID=1538023 RepID=UPI00234FFC3A|nr:zinc-dependent metalloprotease [Aureisphaera galaxeae]MDC8006040.1 zinc-dependent metalloprotease [Aureisphaera galaxeae]
MKRIITIICVCLLGILSLQAQQLKPVARDIVNEKTKGVTFQAVSDVLTENTARVASLDNKFVDPTGVTYLNYDFSKLPTGRKVITLEIPFKKGTLKLNLMEWEDRFDYVAKTESGKMVVNNSKQRHYSGIIEGNHNSLVAISFFEDNIMGIISDETTNYEITKSKEHDAVLIYDASNVKNQSSFDCSFDDSQIKPIDADVLLGKSPTAPSVSKCVDVYFETEVDMYNVLGTENAVDNFVRGLFHQAAIVYYNEDIAIRLSDVMIWTVTDPYTFNSAHDLLIQYAAETGSFNGDIAQLLTFRGDGINLEGAAAGGLPCNNEIEERKSVAKILDNYAHNGISLSPTLALVTHELGHLFGSPHTRACAWYGTGSAIDGCGGVEGFCVNPGIPLTGSIMSYCGNITFANGFGAQPGNLIRDTVANSNCITTCNIECDEPCTIDPEIEYVNWFTNSTPCSYKFIGSNAASPMCDAIYDYEWRIQGLIPPASNDKEFVFDFSNWDNGTYDITLTMTYYESTARGCSFAEETVVIPFTLTCGINNNPTCPTNNFVINEVENCLDYQITMSTNSGVASIDWSYAICGLSGEQPIGNTTGPNHATYFTLPSGNDYDNCYLWVHADINLTNGQICEKSQSILLSCSSGDSKLIALVPNPTANSFTIVKGSKVKVDRIIVKNLQGITVESRASQLEQEFDLSKQQAGMYIVEIIFADGSSEIKKLLLKK